MAVRIRANGDILCAAMHPEEPGDTYIDDGLHYILSVEKRVLVAEPMELHKDSGRWWWRGQAPPTTDPFYLKDPEDPSEANHLEYLRRFAMMMTVR